MGFFSRHKGKLVLGFALATAVVSPVYLHLDRQNQRLEQAITQRIDGSSSFGVIYDQMGNKAMFNAVTRSSPFHDLFDSKKGVYIYNAQGKNPYYLEMTKKDGAYEGTWDFPRFAGLKLPVGSWGHGEITPDATQMYYAQHALNAANQPWVSVPAWPR
jgi:hypothetical protein